MIGNENNLDNIDTTLNIEQSEKKENVKPDKEKIKKIRNYRQKIIMNNFYARSKSEYNDLIWDNIETADDAMLKHLNNKILDTYRMRLNLINNILYSTEGLNISYKKDVLKLFNILAPLSNEYNLGSYKWSHKIVDNKLYIQNSVLKFDFTDNFRIYFLNPIKRLLKLSGIQYKYYHFKSTRYYRNIDIVFTFDFQ